MLMPATNDPTTNAVPVPLQIPCKCCGGPAWLVGEVDFNKNCVDPEGTQTSRAGVPIPYHRCKNCGFLFTARFDNFSRQDFATHIYNAQYALVDPDYAEERPVANAALVTQLFGEFKNDLAILDYGGGNGRLERELRDGGFAEVRTYDPFVQESSRRPDHTFNLVLAFEVVEHTHRPLETFKDMTSLLVPDGLLLFSTLLQSEETQREGLRWGYVAPRNGHVSLYTAEALAVIGRHVHFNFASANQNMHSMFRELPPFARKLFGEPA
jgi:2-polyprenyl-6-hydroxyphenyl methylase/3-demethylubiquinone-9 3-methyltransferase